MALHDELTPREVEVYSLLIEDVRPEKIAAQLCIAVGTVRLHIAHIYEKLGVHSKAGAILYAVRHGLMPEIYKAHDS